MKRFKDGNTSIENQPRSGRPRTASTECNRAKVDDIIKEDRRVTVSEIAARLEIGHSAVQEMIQELGYRKVCACWVPRLLTTEHKVQRKTIAQDLLQRYRNAGDEFLMSIVTGDESWFHHYEPETKRQSMEWHHQNSPTKKKAKTVKSAGKVMGTVFWDAEGCILVEFLEPGQTINAARYVQTLKKLRRALRDKRPGKKIVLQQDNARPHSARCTMEQIEKMGWKLLPYPAYSPDLAPSDYHLFGFVKEQMRGQHYETREDVQAAVRQCLRRAGTEFYRKGIFKLAQRWEKCVQRNGDFVEK